MTSAFQHLRQTEVGRTSITQANLLAQARQTEVYRTLIALKRTFVLYTFTMTTAQLRKAVSEVAAKGRKAQGDRTRKAILEAARRTRGPDDVHGAARLDTEPCIPRGRPGPPEDPRAEPLV